MTFARRVIQTTGFLMKNLLLIAATVLWIQGRVPAFLLAFVVIDAARLALALYSRRRSAQAPKAMTRPDRMVHESGVLVLDFRPSLERARN